MQWTLKSYLLKIISQRKGMNILLSAVGELFHSHFISAEVTREYFAFLSFFLDKKQEYFSCFTVLGRETERAKETISSCTKISWGSLQY